jgi:hypothetical protein
MFLDAVRFSSQQGIAHIARDLVQFVLDRMGQHGFWIEIVVADLHVGRNVAEPGIRHQGQHHQQREHDAEAQRKTLPNFQVLDIHFLSPTARKIEALPDVVQCENSEKRMRRRGGGRR